MRIDLTIDCIRARTLFDPNCGTGLPLGDVATFMAFHFDSRGLRQAGGQAFDVLICIKRFPSRVTRCGKW